MKLILVVSVLILLLGELGFTQGDQSIQDAYSIKITLAEISGTKLNSSICVKFFQDNRNINPVNTTLDSESIFHFEFNQSQVIGSFVSAEDVNASAAAGFYIVNNNSNSIISTINLSSVLAVAFPNTSQYNPLELWPDHNVSILLADSHDDLQAVLEVDFKGVVDVFGLDVHWPTWKVIVVVAATKLGVCFLFAFMDWCCLPLHRASSWDKSKILLGNTIWLFFGGLSAGFFDIVAGVILILTIVLSPFGVKLVRIGVFSLFPFGRVIKCDEQSEAREVCSCIGNVVWLVLIGWAIVLVHIISGIVLCILLVTIPLGLQHFKLAKIAFMPFGHSVALRDDLASDPFERAPLMRNQPGYV